MMQKRTTGNNKKPMIVFSLEGGIEKMNWNKHLSTSFPIGVPPVVYEIAQYYPLCVVSCDKNAHEILKSKDCVHLVKSIRAGANHKWSGDYDPTWRDNVSIPAMIHSMLEELGYPKDHPVQYYDSDKTNVDQVNSIDGWTAFCVDANHGVRFSDVDHLLVDDKTDGKNICYIVMITGLSYEESEEIYRLNGRSLLRSCFYVRKSDDIK
jgi:hypothetical protein